MKIQQLENYRITIYDVKDQLKRFIYDRSKQAFSEGDKTRDSIQSKEELEARQAMIRKKFIESIGGLPSSNTPLNAVVKGVVHCRGFKIEKVIFESRPDTFVTTNLYIPDGISEPRGAVLFLCGHHELAKHHPEYQAVCQYLVNAGLVVLAMDPIGQGERLSYYERSIQAPTVRACTVEHEYAGNQCWPLGDGIARYFVHDAMRAIDYLCTIPEVDPLKIGVTGNSGGGTQTSLVILCDPRIAAAVPATFIMSRETYMYAGGAQDAEQIWPGFSSNGFDHEDILLSMVPRPVRVLSVTYDFFPLEGARRTVDRTRRFWDMYGKSDFIDLLEDDYTHCYTRPLAKAAADFFSKHLLGSPVSPSDDQIQPMDPSLLWCTESGQIRGDYEHSQTVYDENMDRLMQIEMMRTSIPESERKQKAIVWLREKVFYSRKPCELNPRHYMLKGQFNELTFYNTLWWSQEGVFNYGLIFRDVHFHGEELPLTIAVWDGGTTQLKTHLQWIRETCRSGRAVMVLDVSGVGALLPYSLSNNDPLDFYEIVQKLSDDLIWLNDSIAAMRTYDVLRSLDLVERLDHIIKEDIEMYAYGRQGVYAQMAAALDERITNIEVVNGMGSYKNWITARHYDDQDIMSLIVPGMLKHFDLPDLDGKAVEGRSFVQATMQSLES
ncbi:acetylxylan esterase [Paenibacillus filicis]|uniref:Acetylxylan esterase n=1 Tax=Paenibacillus gyeongsangnamensis TaxID=3388067 RepID=A0ABT4Q5K2_9BACL|nr:acetylxylan esterase [Paenibacillus filicis]MCZ8512156.1 acetylxylan esterase [Paenibacillus filicis]